MDNQTLPAKKSKITIPTKFYVVSIRLALIGIINRLDIKNNDPLY